MDALKQQLLKVQQQLAGLSASQKMLTASLLVIMVMTLFYWSNFASTSEMVTVMNGPLSNEDIKSVQDALTAQGVTSDLRAGNIVVSIGNRDKANAAMAQLGYDGKLSAATLSKADDADTDQSFGFGDRSVRDQQLQEKRRKRVEAMISKWPDVKNVAVIIAGEKRIGIMHDDKPTASVSIELRSGGGDVKKLVRSARTQIAGAQPGLMPEDISITVDGTSYAADNPNDPIGNADAQLAAKSASEKYLTDGVLHQLRDIPNVRAVVRVKLNTDNSVTDEHVMNPKLTATGVLKETSSNTDNSQAAPSGEPGVTANVGVMADSSASAGRNSTSEWTEKNNDVRFTYKDTKTISSGGGSVAATAVVGVPESYFRRIWKTRNSAANRDPTEAEMQQTMDSTIPKIEKTVRLATNITDKDSVSVTSFFDFEAPVPAPDASGAGLAALPTGSAFGAKEIAVGALAVISLFMVSMMVRKSAPPAMIAEAAMATMPAHEEMGLMTVGDVIGEVAEGTLTLAGQELSEEAIESKQVIEQVGTMVKANPDVAANLIKRWMNQD